MYLIFMPYTKIYNQIDGSVESLDAFLRVGALTREGVNLKLLSLTFYILETGQINQLVNDGKVDFAPIETFKKTG